MDLDFDICEIREYYDSELRDYDYNELVRLGISHDDADFMVSIGVPENYDDFVFYGRDTFKKTLIEGVEFINIGHYSCYGILDPNALYLKKGSDGLFINSSHHKPPIYMLNKNLRTFFLFELIRNELAMKMKQESEYNEQKYARELRKLYEQIDPVAMKDLDGYWSHLIEDYETGL
ncbi:SUKH-4 family immunity protein [Paenibacillus ehimensis]|uniref:SUKH-4 family immunity protein n=1 Tax=Paenibacillus ehimensis TaxID=79264 RepID=UPI0020A66764|nr:SUKH-4 family immunity protein [Paenibacillus ehimensis]MEC0210440.1 SUKH-4 family immunity protein [Paenibacillus ehimensis]